MKTRVTEAFLIAVCVCTSHVVFAKTAPSSKSAKTKAVRVVRSTPTLGAPQTLAHQASDINFNGLIDQSGKRKHRLASRVATKTKLSPQQRHRRSRVATVDFEDMDMRMKPPTKRETNSVAAARPMQMNPSSTMSVELVRSGGVSPTAENP